MPEGCSICPTSPEGTFRSGKDASLTKIVFFFSLLTWISVGASAVVSGCARGAIISFHSSVIVQQGFSFGHFFFFFSALEKMAQLVDKMFVWCTPTEKEGVWRRTPTGIAGALQCHLHTWGVRLVKSNSLTLFWKAETWVGSCVLTQATRGRVGASWHPLPGIKDVFFGCHFTGSVFIIFWTLWSCQPQEQKLLSMKYILFLSLSWVYC